MSSHEAWEYTYANASASAQTFDIAAHPCEAFPDEGIIGGRPDTHSSTSFEANASPEMQIDVSSRRIILEGDSQLPIRQAANNQEYADYNHHLANTPQMSLIQAAFFDQGFDGHLDCLCSTTVQAGASESPTQLEPTSPSDVSTSPFIPTPTSARPYHDHYEHLFYDYQAERQQTVIRDALMKEVPQSYSSQPCLQAIEEGIESDPSFYPSQLETAVSQD